MEIQKNVTFVLPASSTRWKHNESDYNSRIKVMEKAVMHSNKFILVKVASGLTLMERRCELYAPGHVQIVITIIKSSSHYVCVY